MILPKAEGILAGVDIALAVFRRVDPGLGVNALMRDGSALEPESFIAEIEGSVASILKAERTALNFLQRLSGIATQTGAYVTAVEGYPRSYSRYPQDDAGLPGLREVRRARRRGTEPSPRTW